ncbi:MAG: oligosaccharide flippase family protein, partial [Anaerolineae bacterium]|nr:oligosaccharide flippase family protein [Anaerolineae bacterium]
MIFDKGINLVAGLLIGVWVARYLGVTQYGQFNYAMAYVSLFSPIAMLGLNDLVVRNLVRNPTHGNDILGTAFVLQIISSLLAFGAPVVIAGVIFPDDTLFKDLIFIFALGFLMQPISNVLSYWFESQLQSKHSVLAR